MRRFRIAAMAAVALAAWAPATLAHQDRAGDVHASVRVEDGQFAVYFKNNQDKGHYRSQFGPNGSLLSERVKLDAAPVLEPVGKFRKQDTGLAIRQGADWLVMPDWQWKHKGRPKVLKVRAGKLVERIALNWGRVDVDIVHAFTPTEAGYVVLASTKADKAFHLYAFGRDGKAPARLHEVGVPYRIYDFPRSSSLSLHRGQVVVCWLTRDGRLVATLWDPTSGERDQITLREKLGWNTTLDAAVIGDVLFVAWHAPGADGCQAVIHSLTHDLSKAR